MNSNMPLPGSMKASEWVKLLTDDFTPPDIEKEIGYALLHHLEDLGLLISSDSGDLRWQEFTDGLALKEQLQIIQDGMKRLAQTELGFAIPFFIGFEKIELPTFESIIGSERKTIENKSVSKPERASDLSNLQIVKKVGRQLKPFLDAENVIVKRLLGKRTNKADARILFQYIFGKINSKAQPRKWEQLSRKRHR